MQKIVKLQDEKWANETSYKNAILFDELFERGYYCQIIGQKDAGEIDYLIISTVEPKNVHPDRLEAWQKERGIIDHKSS
jgi:hypothetical protein